VSYDVLANCILVGIAVLVVVLVILLIRLRGPSKASKGNNKFVYNPEIIAGYNQWLNASIGVYMTKFISERRAVDFSKEDELAINSEFTVAGIDYVKNAVGRSIPNFYQEYMSIFHGEDKFVDSIFDKIRAVFIEYVDREMKKRLGEDIKLNTRQERTS
jgi:hypothetical protein